MHTHIVYNCVQESHVNVYTAHQKRWWLEMFFNKEYYSYTGRISRYFYSQIWNQDSIICQPVKQMQTTNKHTKNSTTENLESSFHSMCYPTGHCILALFYLSTATAPDHLLINSDLSLESSSYWRVDLIVALSLLEELLLTVDTLKSRCSANVLLTVSFIGQHRPFHISMKTQYFAKCYFF